MKKNLKILTVASALTVVVFSCAKQQVLESSSDTVVQERDKLVMHHNVNTNFTPGTSYQYSVSNGSSSVVAIEYIAGDIDSRLIITAPHGGNQQPTFMRTRTDNYNYGTLPYDQYSTDLSYSGSADLRTRELAISIADSVRVKTGKRPHLIINHIHRSKLDANRRREVATQGGIYAGPAWDHFHEYIETAKATILANHASGLLIDVHGQIHNPERTEVGYLVTKNQLTNNTNTLGNFTSSSSIRAMVGSGITHTSLIKGTNALGTLLNNQLSYMVTPSAAYPKPGDTTIFTDGNYFPGGYNTSRHGSKFEGTISAIQLEFNSSVRSSTTSIRNANAGKIANALKTYLDTYFN